MRYDCCILFGPEMKPVFKPGEFEIMVGASSRDEDLLKQKDMIIEKQDEQILNLMKSKEEIIKSNKTNVISLKLQNEKYQEIIEKLTKTN